LESLQTGRKGSEFLVKSIKELISGKIPNKSDFAIKLADGLKKVAEDAVKLLTKFVPNELQKSTTTAEASHQGIQIGKKRKAAMANGEEQTHAKKGNHQMQLRNRA
jgi:hypothetical protein